MVAAAARDCGSDSSSRLGYLVGASSAHGNTFLLAFTAIGLNETALAEARSAYEGFAGRRYAWFSSWFVKNK
jgi:hypothetical protein